VSGHFTSIVVCDFEYEITDGDLPNVLCMVAHVLDSNLRHVRPIRLWRGEFGTAPPFDIGPDTLFVAYSAWAELTCFMTLGWKFPTHVFDLHTAFLAREQHSATAQSKRSTQAPAQTLKRCLPRLRHCRLGADRQGSNRSRHW
jgi:hypothetical protein